MNLYSLYNVRFKNKKVDEWYKRLFVRLVNLILPIYYYVSRLFMNMRVKGAGNLNSKTKYIVSLTSYPVRINTLWIVIESILRQKDKPDAIILWLYEGEFDGKSSLPKSLLRLEKWIQIKFCVENIRPHKKYFYTMKMYPQANVITVDDDLIYSPTFVGDLKRNHKKYPNSICSTMTRIIKINNSTIQPYIDWSKYIGPLKKSHKLQLLGGSGTLYPPNALHKEVFNTKILKQKALKADDLWLKVMSLKNNTEIVSLSNTRQRKFLPVIIKNDKRLMDSNIHEGRNDKILGDLMNYYELPVSVFEESSLSNPVTEDRLGR